MGVSGAGKSTIAERLAARLHWPFQEGDDLHPQANRDKMHAGIPLDDADRAPWLARVAAWIDAQLAAGSCGIITCSALKRVYRATIIGGHPDVLLVYLHANRADLEAHLAARSHEFMPSTLLDSQLATLQEPGPDEPAIYIEVLGTPEETTTEAYTAIRKLIQPS